MSDTEELDDEVQIPDPCCYHCSKPVVNFYLCKKCGMHYHPRCANQSGVLSNGAVKACCDIKNILNNFLVKHDRKFDKINCKTTKINLDNIADSVDNLVQNAIKTQLDASIDEIIESKLQNIIMNRSCDTQMQSSIIREINDRNSRKNNLIIYNIIDKNDKTEDRSLIVTMIKSIGIVNPNFKMHRIGIFSSDKNRPIKVIMNNYSDLKIVFSKKDECLKSLPNNAKLVNDRTPLEMKYFKQLKDKLDELNKRDNDNDTKDIEDASAVTNNKKFIIKYINGVATIVNNKPKKLLLTPNDDSSNTDHLSKNSIGTLIQDPN